MAVVWPTSGFSTFASCWWTPVTLTRGGSAALFESSARLPLVAFGTRTVEVLVHAVALGLVLAGVRITGI